MVQLMTLSDGVETVDFYDYSNTSLLADGHDWGSPLDPNRPIELRPFFGANPGAPMAKDTLLLICAKVNRILSRAQVAVGQGFGRTAILTHKPDGMTVSTIWNVRGGTLELPHPLAREFLLNGRIKPTLRLYVESRATTTESDIITAGSVRFGASVSHLFTHYTGATIFSGNTAGLVEGSLWRTNIFTLTPADATPQNGDILYFGNKSILAAGEWDRIIWGLSQNAVGTYTGVWEYWNGAAWTSFTPTTNDFKTTRDWDTTKAVGQIVFPALAGWASTTVNGIAAFWVRWRISAFTNMTTVPSRQNGPVGSHANVAVVPLTSIDGDAPAKALVNLKNKTGTVISGVKGALITGHMPPVGYPAATTPIKPPHCFPFQNADQYVASGDTGAAVTADVEAPYGAVVRVTVGGSGVSGLSDKAQRLTPTQSIRVTPVGGDKIANLGNDNSFFVEIGLSFEDIDGGRRTDLLCQWDETGSLRRFRCGINDRQIWFQMRSANGNYYECKGTTELVPGIAYMLTYEWRHDEMEQRVYVNGRREVEDDAGSSTSMHATGSTVPLTLGRCVSSTDSVGPSIIVSWVWIVDDGIIDTFGKISNYVVPTVKRTAALSVRNSLLWELDDYAASTAVADTGTGTAKNGVRTVAPVNTNDAANARAGYFVGGSGGVPQRIAGMRLAPTLAEEYAGPWRAFVTVSPVGSTLTDISQLELMPQFNVGDINLPFSSPGRRLPNIAAVRSTLTGFYFVWVGDVYLPPVALYDGHRGSGSARNVMQFNLYYKHNLPLGAQFDLGELWLFPLDAWYGEYQAWRSTYQTSYVLAADAGVSFDSRGPGATAIFQCDPTSRDIVVRNPYAKAASSPPRLYPQRTGWLVAVPLRGSDATSNDFVYARHGDYLEPRVRARFQFNYLATP